MRVCVYLIEKMCNVTKTSKVGRAHRPRVPTFVKIIAELAEELFRWWNDTRMRVGNENDGKTEDMFRFNKRECKIKPRTENQDQVKTVNGEFLLRCDRQTQDWLLNGRCIPNEWTYSIACKGRNQGRKDFTKTNQIVTHFVDMRR